jgi:hypothetical protein
MGTGGCGFDVSDAGPEKGYAQVVLEKILDPEQITAFTESFLHGVSLTWFVK